jgi:hypothetical protein
LGLRAVEVSRLQLDDLDWRAGNITVDGKAHRRDQLPLPWCDSRTKRIVVDAGEAINGQVRTLVHELIHALGVSYQTHTRPEAEVIVDTATLIVLSGVGLDTSGETIPYVASWGESGALEAVTEHAELIDRLARMVENAIATDTRTDGAEVSVAEAA